MVRLLSKSLVPARSATLRILEILGGGNLLEEIHYGQSTSEEPYLAPVLLSLLSTFMR